MVLWFFFLAVAVGLDIWRNYLGLSVRLRSVVVLNTIFLFSSVLYYFGFATLTNELSTNNSKATAAGFFFILIAASILYSLEFVDVCCQCLGQIQLYAMKSRLRILLLICITIYLFGAFLTDCGLWGIIHKWSFANSNFKAMVIAETFLFAFIATFIGLDTVLGDVISGKKDTPANGQGLLP